MKRVCDMYLCAPDHQSRSCVITETPGKLHTTTSRDTPTSVLKVSGNSVAYILLSWLKKMLPTILWIIAKACELNGKI